MEQVGSALYRLKDLRSACGLMNVKLPGRWLPPTCRPPGLLLHMQLLTHSDATARTSPPLHTVSPGAHVGVPAVSSSQWRRMIHVLHEASSSSSLGEHMQTQTHKVAVSESRIVTNPRTRSPTCTSHEAHTAADRTNDRPTILSLMPQATTTLGRNTIPTVAQSHPKPFRLAHTHTHTARSPMRAT